MKNRTLNLIPVSKMTHKKKYKKILKTKETGKKREGGGGLYKICGLSVAK